MVESRIRVEITSLSNAVNPYYYGKTTSKKVIEETLSHDMDRRADIAPYGVIATFSIDRSYKELDGKLVDAKDIFDIKVSRRYFDDRDGGYITFFHVDEKVYELFVDFSGRHITNITLSEWENHGYFEDGDDPDNVYGKGGIQTSLVSCDIMEE